jgi:hypothetical protein
MKPYPVSAIDSTARCRLMSGFMLCVICHELILNANAGRHEVERDETFTFLADGRTVHWRCLYACEGHVDSSAEPEPTKRRTKKGEKKT